MIVGAGSGVRLGHSLRKAMVPLGEWPMIVATARRFQGIERIREVVLVVHKDDISSLHAPEITEAIGRPSGVRIVEGGSERQDSVLAGVAALSPEINTVLVHDAARPFVTEEEINSVLDSLASGCPAVFPGVPVTATLKRVDQNQSVVETVDRDGLKMALTPQGASRQLLTDAILSPPKNFTDEMQAIEALGVVPHCVEGNPMNFKITTARDLLFATRLKEASL